PTDPTVPPPDAVPTVPTVPAPDADPTVPPPDADPTRMLSLLPENSHAWQGTPGLVGHRQGSGFSTRFSTQQVEQLKGSADGGVVIVRAIDETVALELELRIELTPSGLIRAQAELTNTAPEPYDLEALTLALPAPSDATELLDFTGRWGRERQPQRHPFTQGAYVRESRRGRPGHDASLLLVAGEAGFGFRRGEVWAVHTAWSGNQRMLAERMNSGQRMLAGGELGLPGELALAPGEVYTSPWVYFAWGDGLDAMSARFHAFIRGLPSRRRRPRPVTGNSWEAVYFDHSLAPLISLAEAFAEVGVERFVLDDGWFRGRRSDRAGLGDWQVDGSVWPKGLHPLVERVRALSMEFGLWVEPEMVNLNSDLARAHPEWILAPGAVGASGGRWPLETRHQQVLNLAEPAALAFLKDRLDALISEYGLTYLKWDHNRDLLEPGDQRTGRAGVHKQTLALYELWDYLKGRHPDLEIESCASGGGRADLGIMLRADRLWASDCTDAHERQAIQRHTGLLLPPELVGAHISAERNHQTGRWLSLPMRAVTAMFGDLGVEWNVAGLGGGARAELAEWIALYKRWRPLLHSGAVIRTDQPDPAHWVHGVVAPDRSQALFAIVPLATSIDSPPGAFRFAGLDPDRRYRVEPLPISRASFDERSHEAPAWWAEGLTTTGRVLMRRGLRLPELPVDSPALVSATAQDT
ncbi:MAG: alpha-galactosidase, partial [Bifidobacteriaceae bacterium]|nr:alpha-galactosidase [Bifidobacteriaceae bacterium]